MKSSRLAARLLPGILFFTALAAPRPSYAIDKTVRSMIVGAAYGVVGGTVLGLAAYPTSGGQTRTIFIGSSIGLYLGAVVGLFYAMNTDDPGNPLRPPPHPASSGPLGDVQSQLAYQNRPLVKFDVPVIRF